jgi:hypothetical protein
MLIVVPPAQAEKVVHAADASGITRVLTMNTTQLFLGNPANWKDVQVHLSAMQALFGGWRVYVFGDRDTIIQRVSPVTQEQRFRLTFTENDFQSLLEACIENDLLTVEPFKRPGHPDETMIQITLINPRKESQTANKWAGDKLAEFDTISRILFELTARTRDMIPYHTGPFDWSVSPIDPP